MTVQLKTVRLFDVKTDGDAGTFEAYASTYDVDRVGDMVRPGAFKNTLADWASKGDAIPLLWSHRMDDPDYNLGHVVKAEERDAGLWISGALDLTHQKAIQVYKLLKGRRVGNLSFAYDTLDQAPIMHGGKSVNELRELKLYEVSLTPIGANQNTQVLGVKHAAELLLGLTPDVLEKADVVGLLKSMDHTRTVLEQVLGAMAPQTPPAEKSAEESAEARRMRYQTTLLGLSQ
ncbi:prohead protease [Nocardia phage NBR1]|uniref:head maturation protease n=1 Tax=Nocardia phage NBR1 TaxID=1109711 RepID=UPI00023EED98|nr:head maturation protease [Nocardia phage NBR1]AEV52219.1 prohead protease [Nocardia phage NBR1]